MDASDTIDKRCQLMATLSPLVRSKVETEQWRINFLNSDPEADSIQQALFACLISDLTDLGVDTVSTMDDLYEHDENLDLLLGALGWIMPNSFYPRMRRDAGLKAGIENILSGSMDGDALHNYLDFIGGSDVTGGYISGIFEMCQYAKSVLASDDVFKMFLRSMVTSANEEVDVTTYAVNDPKEYHLAITKVVTELAKAKGTLIENLTDRDQQTLLDRRVYFASRAILAQDKLNDYGWLFTTDPATLDEDDRQIYLKKRRILTVGLKISPEYYTARNFLPGVVDALGIVCFHMAFDAMSIDEALRAVKEKFPGVLTLGEGDQS